MNKRRVFWHELEASIEKRALDLVVVGGGINGVGIARDAALNGLSTLLIEKGDYGEGTTAWSSRLIHGGLRYLDQFEFGLVKESLQERATQLRAAPHLVRPLEIAVPVYRDNRYRLWKVKIGMWLYDWLSRGGELPQHRSFSKAEFEAEYPSFQKNGLEGGVSYFDAQVLFSERLALENVLSAKGAGANIINHAEARTLRLESGRVQSLEIFDARLEETVKVPLAPTTVVVNAGGPWVDRVLATVNDQSASERRGSQAGDDSVGPSLVQQIGGVKGSHILVDAFSGAPSTAVYVEASDGRPYFVLPWLGRLLIGTTERRFDANLDAVKSDEDEIEYLIAETNRVIPSASLRRDDVLLSYAGVRALPAARKGALGKITRKHLLIDHRSEGIDNLWSLVGGKLTTYRAVAEEIVDRYLALRGRKRSVHTETVPLVGAFEAAEDRQALFVECRQRVGPETAGLWLQIYGARARDLLRLVSESSSFGESLTGSADSNESCADVLAQVHLAYEHEDAETLTDVLCRRLVLFLREPGLFQDPSVVRRMAERVASVYDWDETRCDAELFELERYLTTRFFH